MPIYQAQSDVLLLLIVWLMVKMFDEINILMI